MPKPKKGKVKEEVVITPEQRREMQLKARADLRHRMQAETKNSKINSLKIQNQWRKIMRLGEKLSNTL